MQNKAAVLKCFTRESMPALALIFAISVIAAMICYFTGSHWSNYVAIAAVLSVNLAVYADYIRKIHNGSFGSTRFEAEALNKWFGTETTSS